MNKYNIIEELPPKDGGGKLPPKDGGGKLPPKDGGKSKGENSWEKCKTDLEAIAADGYKRLKDEETYNKVSATIYDKKTYLCKANNSTSYHVKRKEVVKKEEDPNQGGDTKRKVGSSYQNCTGKKIRFRGCKDTDGIIHRVQGCIGAKQDSKFGPETESKLIEKTGKEYFTTDQVDAICSGKLSPDGKEETTFNWDTLIDNNQIYNSGYKYKLKDGTEVYVIKYEKDTNKKLPLTNMSGADPDKFDYFVYYPIKSGESKGNYGQLVYEVNTNGVKVVRVKTDRNWTWAPDESYEVIDVTENTIKRILNNILSEQKHYGGPASGRESKIDQGNQTIKQQGDQGSKQQGDQGVKVVDITPELTNMKTKALGIIDQWDDYNAGLSGLSPRALGKGKVNTLIDDSRSKLESTDPKSFCSQDIDGQLAEIEKNRNQYGSMMTTEDKNYLSQLETILKGVKSKCEEAKNQSSQQQGDQDVKQQGDQGAKQQGDQGNKQQVDQNVMKQETKTVECSIDKLIQYVVDGLQGVSNDLAKITKQREDLCYCYKTGKFNDMNARGKIGDLFKEKFEDIKDTIDANVAPEKQISRKLRNKKLGWNEISALIKGEGIYDVTLNRNYIDRYFGTDRCKATVVTESIRSVKDIINEAVNQKRNNKSKIGSVISEAVVAKRKEKTRDIIAEDLIRMIKGY